MNEDAREHQAMDEGGQKAVEEEFKDALLIHHKQPWVEKNEQASLFGQEWVIVSKKSGSRGNLRAHTVRERRSSTRRQAKGDDSTHLRQTGEDSLWRIFLFQSNSKDRGEQQQG